MILVAGGCFQGKTEYALEKFQISRDEAADGRTCPLHMIYTTKLLYQTAHERRTGVVCGRAAAEKSGSDPCDQ